MTDTTDVKALRERMMQHREAALTGNTPSFEDCELLVCDLLRALTLSNKQLEAERQRADDADARIVELEKGEKYWFEEFKKAEAEIAALKGDQVPVAFTGSGSLAAIKGGHEGHIWGASAEAHPVPLYDHPQKPVVLPPLASIHSNWSGEYLDKADVIAAIEAAGGIVKDGE